MSNEPRIEAAGKRGKKDDALFEQAKMLVDVSIKLLMQTHGVSRETASYWLPSASDAA